MEITVEEPQVLPPGGGRVYESGRGRGGRSPWGMARRADIREHSSGGRDGTHHEAVDEGNRRRV